MITSRDRFFLDIEVLVGGEDNILSTNTVKPNRNFLSQNNTMTVTAINYVRFRAYPTLFTKQNEKYTVSFYIIGQKKKKRYTKQFDSYFISW